MLTQTLTPAHARTHTHITDLLLFLTLISERVRCVDGINKQSVVLFLAFPRSLPASYTDMEQLASIPPTDDGDEGVHTLVCVCVCARGESWSYLSRLIPPLPPSLSLSLALLTLKHTHTQTNTHADSRA